MHKPSGYDEAHAFTGEYETLEPGGYVCRIKDVREAATRSGAHMLTIAFDIEEGPKKGYFQRLYERNSRSYSDAMWRGTYNQLTEGTSLSFFKGMITAIQESNPGYVFNWDETTLKGKLFGGVFGREEYVARNGDVKMSPSKCLSIRSVAAIRAGVEPPKDKLLNPSVPYAGSRSEPKQEGFVEVNDSELPF